MHRVSHGHYLNWSRRRVLQRRFLNTGGAILNQGDEIVVQLDRRTYSPVLRQADLPPTVTVPLVGDRRLRYQFA